MKELTICCIVAALIFLALGINLLREYHYVSGVICLVIGIIAVVLMMVFTLNTPSTSSSSSSSKGYWGADGYYNATPNEADKARKDALKWMEENW